jgi:hypothetical protein
MDLSLAGTAHRFRSGQTPCKASADEGLSQDVGVVDSFSRSVLLEEPVVVSHFPANLSG